MNTFQPPPLRIAAIRLCGFRAFPHPITIRLNQSGPAGCNLVLYGENGSGKSSIGKAIRDLLALGPKPPVFDDYCYRYGTPQDDREVTLSFNDNSKAPLTWKPAGRDTSHPDFTDMARTRGWLDYRAVWRVTEVPHWSDCVRVYDILVETLLVGCESPLLNSTFGESWRRICADAEQKPTRGKGSKVQRGLERLQRNIKTFNQALEAFLPELEKRANLFLKEFAPWTNLSLTWKGGASYSSARRSNKFASGNIELRMHYRDRGILKAPAEILNEARVTAIGLSLYLAALSQSAPALRADGSSFPRILVLDDVLLSLDMAHRRPLLKVLREHFQDWQVILLTCDRAWYEIAKQQLEGWSHHELFTVRVGDYDQPLVREDQDHLYWALAFLEQGHVKAAAVHLRTKFELVLKWACLSLGLAVKYHPEPEKTPASDFWAALKSATFEIAPSPCFRRLSDGTVKWWQNKAEKERVVPLLLEKRIEHAVSWVLNPLSHSQTLDRHRSEIEDAVFAVDELESVVRKAITLQKAGPVLLRQMLLILLREHVSTTQTATGATALLTP